MILFLINKKMSTYEIPAIEIVNKNTNVDNIKNITDEKLDNNLENNFILLSLKM